MIKKRIIFTDKSDLVLKAYLKDINKYKLLNPEEIGSLVKSAQEGDNEARNQVVNANLRFVVTVAKQFQNRGVPLMDLINSGNEGLIRAVTKYNPDLGVTFLSYSVWWIKQAILNAIYWQGKDIRLPLSQQLIVNTIAETTNKFVKEHCRFPSPEEISELTNIPIQQIDFLSQYANKVVSVDDYVGDEEESHQVCEIIPDNNPPLEDEINKKFVAAELLKYINKLTDREHDLIRMLFGIGMQKVNTKVIAEMYGVGNERIRQMKEKALSKLRKNTAKLKNMI